MVNILKADNQDLQDVLTLLKDVDLPEKGVADHFHNFFVARENSNLVGCAGIEIYEDVGLIRSVAVRPTFQGQGLGLKLVETIHTFSREKGLKRIYLLTNTAEKFFLKLDYTVIPREEADSRVKQSVEFTICPDSTSTTMIKVLKYDKEIL